MTNHTVRKALQDIIKALLMTKKKDVSNIPVIADNCMRGQIKLSKHIQSMINQINE